MADLNINVGGSVAVLKEIMEQARQTVMGTADSIKASVASIPAATSQSMTAAAASILDLKTALNQIKAAMKETEEIIIEAGGTMNATTGIVRQYAIEQAAAAEAQSRLTAATRASVPAMEEAGEAENLFRGRLIMGENGMRAFITSTLPMEALFGAMAIGFGITMVDAMVKAELELGNLSRMIGMSVPQLASMEKAFEAAGGKSDDMTSVFRRLDRTISDAASGVDTARLTLRELGVDMTLINSGIIPDTNVVLAQMADYLHANSGNAEIMRAALRALGTDSVAMGGFLAQGSQKVKEQIDEFHNYGDAANKTMQASRELNRVIVDSGSIWDRFKLVVVSTSDEAVRVIPVIIQSFTGLNNVISETRSTIQGASSDMRDFMSQSLKGLTAAPAPPEFAMQKPEKEKAAHEKKGKDQAAADAISLSEEVALAERQAAEELAQIERVQRAKEEAARRAHELAVEESEARSKMFEGMDKDDAKHLAMQQKIAEQEAAARKKMFDEIDAAAKKSEKEQEKEAQALLKLFDPINRAMDGLVRDMLSGTMRMSEAFRRFGVDLLRSVTTALLNATLKLGEQLLVQEIMEHSSMARRLAALVAGEGAKKGIQVAAATGEATEFAGVGAAAAFASVLAALPFPANVAAAPEIAATEFAAIMAVGLPKAERGAAVPRDMPIYAHAGEEILPKSTVAEMSGGGMNVHIHALDSKSVADFMHGNRAGFTKMMRDAIRNGARIRR